MQPRPQGLSAVKMAARSACLLFSPPPPPPHYKYREDSVDELGSDTLTIPFAIWRAKDWRSLESSAPSSPIAPKGLEAWVLADDLVSNTKTK